MDQDVIAELGIDGRGRLHVVPGQVEFPLIYRAGLDIAWDASARSLHSPTPRDGDDAGWYRRLIAAAAREYGVRLHLTDRTVWIDVEPGLRAQLIEASASVPNHSSTSNPVRGSAQPRPRTR